MTSSLRSLCVLAVLSHVAGCQVVSQIKGKATTREPAAAPSAAPAGTTEDVASAAPPSRSSGTGPGGIPEILVGYIREQYADSTDNQENNFAMLRGAAQAFGPAWTAYEKRKAQVDQVIARAAELEKVGKLAEAEATLTALLGPVPKGGPRWSDRGMLEPADADWPALESLARIAIARRSSEVSPIPTVLRVAQALWNRRRVGARDSELLIWLAQCQVGARCADEYRTASERLRFFQSALPPVAAAVTAADDAEKQGRKRAMELLAEVLTPKGTAPRAPTAVLMEQIIDESGYERWPKTFDESAALIASFDSVWQPYSARRALVLSAVADAAALERAGKNSEARAKLESVITAAERDGAGQLPTARRYVEQRDAELPAVQALAELLRGARDLRGFIELGAAFRYRRAIGDADTELALHIKRSGRVEHDGGFDAQSGADLARAHWNRLRELGVTAGGPEAELQVERGAPMLLVLPATNWQSKARALTVKPRSLGFKMVIDGNDKHCKVTDRVDRIEPDGSVRYVEDCTYTPKKITYTADVALSEAAPSWSQDGNLDKVHVLGTAAGRGGPRSWKLKDAVILDLRFER